MNTSPSPKWFPSEVQAPRTKLITWKTNDYVRLIEKERALPSLNPERFSELMSCCGNSEGEASNTRDLEGWKFLWKRASDANKEFSSE